MELLAVFVAVGEDASSFSTLFMVWEGYWVDKILRLSNCDLIGMCV